MKYYGAMASKKTPVAVRVAWISGILGAIGVITAAIVTSIPFSRPPSNAAQVVDANSLPADTAQGQGAVALTPNPTLAQPPPIAGRAVPNGSPSKVPRALARKPAPSIQESTRAAESAGDCAPPTKDHVVIWVPPESKVSISIVPFGLPSGQNELRNRITTMMQKGGCIYLENPPTFGGDLIEASEPAIISDVSIVLDSRLGKALVFNAGNRKQLGILNLQVATEKPSIR